MASVEHLTEPLTRENARAYVIAELIEILSLEEDDDLPDDSEDLKGYDVDSRKGEAIRGRFHAATGKAMTASIMLKDFTVRGFTDAIMQAV